MNMAFNKRKDGLNHYESIKAIFTYMFFTFFTKVLFFNCRSMPTQLYNRFAFNSRVQSANESLSEFASSLSELSSRCQYEADEELVQTLIRDRFIVGLRNKTLQTLILEEDKLLTVEDVLEFSKEKEVPDTPIVKTKSKRSKKKAVKDFSKNFSCQFCKAAFRHKRNLVRHFKLSHKDVDIEGEVKCSICDQSFFSKRGLLRHLTLNHPDLASDALEKIDDQGESKVSELSKCQHCKSTFKHKRNLLRHLKSNHAEAWEETCVKCDVCSASFVTKLGLRQHYTTHHLNTDDLSEIREQDKTFRPDVLIGKEPSVEVLKDVTGLYESDTMVTVETKEAFNIGNSAIAVQEDDRIIAVKPVELIDQSNLEIINSEGQTQTLHLLHDTELGETQSIEIVTNESAIQAIPQEISIKVNSELCDLCGAGFQDLSAHFRNVHAKHRPYKCHLCTFSHPLKGHLAQHIRHKHMEAKFICEVCGQKHRSAQAVREHISMVHEGLRPFECPVCHKSFAKKEYIKEHVAVTHKGEMPFACNICSQQFSRRRVLLIHKRTAHENTWFDCEICGKRFKEKCAVKTHIKIVHENKFRFNCKVCGMGYRSNKPFKEHMILKHGVQN